MNSETFPSGKEYFLSALKKRIGKMISQPTSIDFKTLDSVLRGIGCKLRSPGGSHYVYIHPNVTLPLSVPKAKPIKKCYIIQAIKLFGLKEKYDEIT